MTRLAYCSVVTTIVIPAYNESRVLGRLLSRIVVPDAADSPTVLVVANGCTDQTADIARSFGNAVRVLSIPVASKRLALAASDRAVTSFPRLYVDADVEIGRADIAALTGALLLPGTLAVAPERHLELAGCRWPVRWYLDIWARLPAVRDGLFGRGAFAVSADGHRRIANLPMLMADDLAVALAFGPGEARVVPQARVTTYPPRTLGALIRRRIRVATGVAQLERTAGAPPSTARTTRADLTAIVADEPALLPKLAVFLLVTAIARTASRWFVARGDFRTWQRDETSRAPGQHAAGLPGETLPGEIR